MSKPETENQNPDPAGSQPGITDQNSRIAGKGSQSVSESDIHHPKSPWLRNTALIIIAVMVVFVTGTVSVSELEERDQFCIQCHLPPEETYYARAQAALTVTDPFELADLSSFHYWDAAQAENNGQAGFRCIDCHRGNDGLVHRAETLVLAGGDTLTWLVGEQDETIEKGAIPNVDSNLTEWAGPERYNRRPDILNAGCLKCHQDALTLVGFDNHFHNRLPAAQEAFAQTGRLNYPENWTAGVGSEDLLQADETILTCLDCHRTHVQGFESEYFMDTGQVVFHACVQCHKETGQGPLDLAR